VKISSVFFTTKAYSFEFLSAYRSEARESSSDPDCE
jgi:hypothetical protein